MSFQLYYSIDADDEEPQHNFILLSALSLCVLTKESDINGMSFQQFLSVLDMLRKLTVFEMRQIVWQSLHLIQDGAC